LRAYSGRRKVEKESPAARLMCEWAARRGCAVQIGPAAEERRRSNGDKTVARMHVDNGLVGTDPVCEV
jgi:hypothetical protein